VKRRVDPCPMCASHESKILAATTFADKEYHLARCAQCGLHFCAPTPTAVEIASFYQGDYHADLREDGGTEKRFGSKFARYRGWVLKFVTGGRSLDIGTSTGLFPALLKRAGFDAEGIEYNKASAEWGQAHFGVKIRNCGLEESDAERGSYDFISMTDVLEHTEHPLRYLQAVREYLKPGGHMLITFPDIASLESCYLRALASMLHRDWIWSCNHIPLHVWEFTPATARAMFDKAGFDTVGFRRSHETAECSLPSLYWLRLPLHLLRIPGISAMAGTQMEFVIRRRG
jgi:SAM-dependent methyltransferase